jgi:hypothetical protein
MGILSTRASPCWATIPRIALLVHFAILVEGFAGGDTSLINAEVVQSEALDAMPILFARTRPLLAIICRTHLTDKTC